MKFQQITNFIGKELPEKLQNDLQKLKIVKEADIECSAYFHIRNFIGEGSEWTILARKHVPITGHFIDLLLFHKDTPSIAIELKWSKSEIPEKDRRSLEKAINNLGVQRAYWISMVMDEVCNKPQRQHEDKRKLFQILIPLGLDNQSRSKWIGKRMKFRQEMKIGRNASS